MKLTIGDLLRNKITNVLCVVYLINKVGVLVIDLSVHEDPVPLKVILLRDIKNWEEDKTIEEKKIRAIPKYKEDFDYAQAAYDLGVFIAEV